jgi:SSS family solute:Na+ symporter
MTTLDWIVIGAYLVGMLILSAFVGAGQQSREDYYLGGGKLPAWSLATSTIATQCSTNSLLGAPAFVGFVAGGGMIWLQYELAVPLAMLALMFLFLPMRQGAFISVYEFLEQRLGPNARLVASSAFQLFRGIATGVTVYGVSLVVTLLIDVSYTQAVLILMGVTIAYDVLGGMRAVVFSDVIQIVLLIGAVVTSLFLLGSELGDVSLLFAQRTSALDFSWGLDHSGNYGFWPMLIGGFFLYAAYYGCDQSQAQRVLAARNPEDTRKVLLLNGVLRFPLVLMYCLLGLALAAYASDREFLNLLPKQLNGQPNYNLAYPIYVLTSFPPGLVGLVMVGVFAAAMSSIDSALNSLSAATIEDYFNQSGSRSERTLFIASKLSTLGWGLFAVAFSYQVEKIAPTVLEAINKVGSMANGPLLALFVIALIFPGVGERRALSGFFMGLISNGALWLLAPGVSWLWWNVSGFALAMIVALAGATIAPQWPGRLVPARTTMTLIGMAGLIFSACICFELL